MQPGGINLLRGGQKLTERKEQCAERMRRRSVGSKSESEKEEKQLKERKQRDAKETDRRRRRTKTEIQIFW